MTKTVYGFSGEQIKAGMFDAKGPIEPTTLTREHLAEMERMQLVIDMASKAGVFEAYYAQSLTELRNALLRFHALSVGNDDRQAD